MREKHMVCIKMAVSWDVAPCSVVDTERRFRDAYCLHHQGYEQAVHGIFSGPTGGGGGWREDRLLATAPSFPTGSLAMTPHSNSFPPFAIGPTKSFFVSPDPISNILTKRFHAEPPRRPDDGGSKHR